MGSVSWRKRGNRYLVSWRLDDGSQGGKTVDSPDEARDLAAEKRLEMRRGTWRGRRSGRLSFGQWADDWWEVWAADPDRSPTTLAATENRLRRHIRPWFGDRPIERISPAEVRRWQAQLAVTVGRESLLACRSIIHRILQFAEDEGAIASNPVRKVPPPKRRADPEELLGEAKRRAFTPEEAGRLLACVPLFWWDHVLTFLGTGLRFGELAGLRCRRVHLDRPVPVLQVVDVRYQAGRQFGSGFKSRPKSDAGIRELPLAPLVIESIRRQLPPGSDADLLVFTGPGGGNGVPAGTRTTLSRYNFRRVYQHAVARASSDLVEVDPHGPHDLRHTFSTWLEDAGIPARVIDELMGHERSRRGEFDGGSRIGARYRHTTPEMAVRVVAAIQERLTVVVRTAEATLETDRSSHRVF
jgi:integrase